MPRKRGGFGSAYYGTATGGAPAAAQPARAPRAKSGFGSRYSAGTAATRAPRPAPRHRGGFLHGLEHVAGQTLTDLKDVAVNLPGGLYHTGGELIHHPGRLGETMVKQTVQDLRHPLRHPGYTLLDALGIAGGGAEVLARIGRVAETGRAVDLLTHAPPGERVFRAGEGDVHGLYARSALARRAQKTTDALRARHPEMRFGLRSAPEKIGFERAQNERVKLVLADRPAHQLVAATKKLKPHERLAMRVVAEEVPLQERIVDAEKMLGQSTGRTKRLLTSHLKQLRRVETVVHDVAGPDGTLVPRFKPGQADLIHLYEKAKQVANKSEQQRVQAGLLSAAGAETRKSAVGREIRGQYQLAVDGTVLTGSHAQIAGKIDARIRQLRKTGLPNDPQAQATYRGRLDELTARRDQLRGVGSLDVNPTLGSTIPPADDTARLEARLNELDNRWNHLVDQVTAAEHGAPGDYADITRRRNMQAKKRRNRGLEPLPTVRSDLRNLGESKLIKLIRDKPDEPVVKRLKAEIEEAHAIRERLNARGDAAIFGTDIPDTAAAVAHPDSVKAGFSPDALPDLFHNREGFYVTYKTRKRPGSLGKQPQIGSQGSIGVPRPPSELKNPYTGTARRTGDVNPDTPRIVAQQLMETNRFLTVWRQRRELGRLSKPVPTTEHDIPIRPIWLKNKKWPPEVRDLIDRIDHADPEEQPVLAQRLHDFVFPKHVTHEDVGVRYIDSRLLGKQNLPRPLVGIGQHTGAKRVLAVTDAVNNAERLALLYAKPAYVTPNILGNVALNLVHGVYSPRNLAIAARWTGKLDTETHALEDALMGEGVVSSVAGETGIGNRFVQKAAHVWQPLVDTRFRRAAFRYEARRAGFTTAARYKQLLTDPAHETKLIEITRRANNAIIDYGRMGPVEQDLVRRIVFLYPWTKGATVYAGHFVAEHPIQASVVGKVGAQGKERRQAQLGQVPSWAEALFQVGHRGNNPLVANPAAAAILQTPAQVLEAGREAVGGNVRSAYDLSSFLNPAGSALLAGLSRRQPFTGYTYKPTDSFAKIVGENLYSGIPAYTLEQRLTHPNPKSVFPMSRRDAMLQFLLGSIAPRPVNLRTLHAHAKQEQTGRR